MIGIAGQGDNVYKIGRLALKSVIYFEVVTTLALILGIFAVNIAKPGNAFNIGGLNASTIASDNTTISWATELEVPMRKHTNTCLPSTNKALISS